MWIKMDTPMILTCLMSVLLLATAQEMEDSEGRTFGLFRRPKYSQYYGRPQSSGLFSNLLGGLFGNGYYGGGHYGGQDYYGYNNGPYFGGRPPPPPPPPGGYGGYHHRPGYSPGFGGSYYQQYPGGYGGSVFRDSKSAKVEEFNIN